MKAQFRTSLTARTVGKIDEAHLLSHDQLEAIRMLTNSDLDSASPAGRPCSPASRSCGSMKLGVLAALDQRIAVRYAMHADDRRGDSRLPAASHPRSPAAPTRCSAMTPPRSSTTPPAATPRAVNRLAVAALIATYATRKTIADEAAARAAVAEVSDQ